MSDEERKWAGTVTLPEGPLTGGCQCGRLRYEITGVPVTLYACHCSLCQRQSGSGFGMSLQVPAEAVRLEGPQGVMQNVGGSGKVSDHRFCPDCGTRISHQIQGRPIVVIKPGTLDRRDWLRPAGHIFTDDRQPWVVLPDDGTLIHPGSPDMPALHARWALMIGQGG